MLHYHSRDPHQNSFIFTSARYAQHLFCYFHVTVYFWSYVPPYDWKGCAQAIWYWTIDFRMKLICVLERKFCVCDLFRFTFALFLLRYDLISEACFHLTLPYFIHGDASP